MSKQGISNIKDRTVEVKAMPMKSKKDRFVIVEAATGEVLDDCSGYGYKSAKSAHVGYARQQKLKFPTEAHKKTKEIQNWLKAHKPVLKDIEAYDLDDWIHQRENISEEEIAHILEDREVECPYTPKEIRKAYFAEWTKAGDRFTKVKDKKKK